MQKEADLDDLVYCVIAVPDSRAVEDQVKEKIKELKATHILLDQSEIKPGPYNHKGGTGTIWVKELWFLRKEAIAKSDGQ